MGLFDDYRDSVDGMAEAAARSGLVGELPLLFITSARRGGGPWHSMGLATDWGNNSDQWLGSQQQRDLAVWLESYYGPYSLELIHTFPDGTGIYWKNGYKVDGVGFYGLETVNAHRGHVHWAITRAGLEAADANVPKVQLEPPLSVADRLKVGALQKTIGADVDMVWGPLTDLKLSQIRDYYNGHLDRKAGVIVELQKLWGQTPDGIWGPKTDAAYNLWRLCLLNK